MSGLREIIQWLESEWIFNPENTVEQEYAEISAQFDKDNRLPLDDILGDDKAKLLDFIESKLARAPSITEDLKEIQELEQTADTLERRVRELFTIHGQIIRGKDSIVLPKGFVAIEPDIIAIEEIPEENILTKAFNFLKGLFR